MSTHGISTVSFQTPITTKYIIYNYYSSSRYVSCSNEKPKNIRTNLINNSITTSIISCMTNTTKPIPSFKSTRTYDKLLSEISNRPHFSILSNTHVNIITPTLTLSKNIPECTNKFDFDHHNRRGR